MRKRVFGFSVGMLAFTVFSGLPLQAQNAVANPFFSTYDLQHWTATDPTYSCILGDTNLGMDYYCLRKYPGLPSNNGAMTQQVHLVAGNTYEFSANIAVKYCSS